MKSIRPLLPGGYTNQKDREYFLGERMLEFCGKDNLKRVTEFIDSKDWECKAAELYSLVLQHHCATTDRAHAAARAWRWTSIGSWVVTIVAMCLALGLSGQVEWPWVFVIGVVAFLVLMGILAVACIRMDFLEHST